MKTVVLKIKGLTDEQIEEEFSEFFNMLVDKYPNQLGVGISFMRQKTEGEKEILRMAGL